MRTLLLAGVAVCAIVTITLPCWLPVPYPARGLVQDLPPHKLPRDAASIQEVCGSNAVQSQRLLHARRLFDGRVKGPESVAVSEDGVLYMGDTFGFVWSATPNSSTDYELNSKPMAFVGPGRPLGMAVDTRGNLIICDVPKGLLMIERDSHQLVVLGNRVSDASSLAAGSPIVYADDLDIAKDGTVYFSDANDVLSAKKVDSEEWDVWDSAYVGMLKGDMSGRLLAYHPSNRSVSVLMSDLWFANGVALSADESFVVVAETFGQRLYKVWLKGPKSFQSEILVDGLPGFPDNVGRSSDGNFWVVLAGPAKPFLKYTRGRFVRLLLSWLPQALRLEPDPWGAILKVSPEGQVLDCLLDMKGDNIRHITGVTEHNGRLFTGHLHMDYISYLDLDTPTDAK